MSASRILRRTRRAGRGLARAGGAVLLLVVAVVLGAQAVRHSPAGPELSALDGTAPAPAPRLAPRPPSKPRVLLVRPTRPSRDGTRQQTAASRRIAAWLEAAGVPFASIPDTALSLATLRPYRVAVLPLNRLPRGNVQSLQAYVAQGGRLFACYPEAPEAFFSLLGVSAGGPQGPAFPGQLRRITLSGTRPADGFPSEMEQHSGHALPLQPRPGTRVLGWWQRPGQAALPAVTANRAGILVGHWLTASDARRKREFLLAALGELDPVVWAQAAVTRRQRAAARLETLQARWAEQRTRPELRQRRERVAKLLAQARQATGALPEDGRAAYRQAARAELLADCVDSALTPAPHGELRGFWIHTYRPTNWDEVMARAKAGGLNAAFVRVGRGGNVIYPGSPLPRDAWAEEAGGDELQRAIEAARRHGLQFHAWRVVYHLGSASQEYRDRMAAEDRLVRDPAGKQSPWANPGDPRNQDLEYRTILDLVKRYRIDGLHLDYIRYPDDPHFDFDYGPVSRREFERAAGVKVARWPADVRQGSLRRRYEEWQQANISRLVQRVAAGVRKEKPQVQLSAAVWRSISGGRTWVRQDWPRWVRAGWLDFVVPMNYVLTPEEQAEAVRAQIQATGGARPLLAGIGNWQLSSSGEVLAQIRAARAAGAKGFVLFSYNDDYIAEHLEMLAAGTP
ncbi:MAG: family 10 glycosylhydrolase [Armatimonadetes bacterium]|nr:family 10 glycosylhydrolase [Armatimonadota bacterium]